MDSNLNGGQALNLSSKAGGVQRSNNANSNNGERKSFKNQQPQHNFDVLAPFGGDLNAAVAAIAAASAASSGQNDVAALASAAANFSALAQLTSNPKLAAMIQLQQQQFMNQSLPSLAPPPPPGHASSASATQSNMPNNSMGQNSSNKPNYTRYQQLLSVIDEMGKDLRTTYLGNKNSTERLKRGIASARILVKDCQMECDRNTKQ